MLDKVIRPLGINKFQCKVALMCLCAGVSYGLAGIGVILLMTFMSRLSMGRDSAASHGISASDSS